MYINNNLMQSKEITLSGNVPGYYTAFKNISGAGYEGGSYFANGYLDDIRIYNRALSAGEIQYLYTKTQGRYK